MNYVEETIDFEKYFDDQHDESAKVRPASEFAQQVIDSFYGETSAKSWVSTGFQKVDGCFELRASEVTLWTGINKHGKTTLLSQVMLSVMGSDKKVGLLSLEMAPHKSMAKMVKQASGVESPSIPYIHAFHKWTDSRLWILNHVGKLPTKRVKAIVVYMRKVLGIDHVVIDSLMKCGMGTDDYNAQKDFIDELCSIARDTGVSIHLVAHMKKGENERTAPGKFDVKGASELTDMVDNIMIIWKNIRKSEKPNDPVVAAEPDGFMRVAGQRHFPWEGSFAFWFDKGSQQFREHQHSRPTYIDLNLLQEAA